MNYFTTIFLLLLLIVVGVFYVSMDRLAPPPVDEADWQAGTTTQQGTPLFSPSQFPHESIKSITIARGGTVYELTYDGSKWQQVKPVRFDLEEWSSQRLGKTAAELAYVESFKRSSSQSPTLEDLGLSPPDAIVTFRFGDDATILEQTIRIGARLGIGGRGYITTNDDERIYVVDDDLHEQVEQDKLTDLRSKSIESPSEGQVDRVMLMHGAESFTMTKSSGNWSLDLPHSGRLDRKHVESLLNDIKGAYINEFIKDQPQDQTVYGLDEPAKIVTIHKPAPPDVPTATSQPAESTSPNPTTNEPLVENNGKLAEPTIYTLCIGSAVDLKKENYFATWTHGDDGGDVVFSLSKSSVEKLDKSVDDMRDARITPLEPDNVRQLTIQTAEQGNIGLLRSTDQWQFDQTYDPGFTADNSKCKELVETITSAKAHTYLANAKPEGDPAATLKLGALAQPEPDILKFYDTDNPDNHLVMRNNETTGYLVKTEDLVSVFAPALALRDRIVLHLPQITVNRISVKRPDSTTFDFERQILPGPPLPGETLAPNTLNDTNPVKPATEAPASAQTQPATRPTEEPASPPAPQVGPWQMIGYDTFESSAFDDLLRAVTPLQAENWLSEISHPEGDAHLVEIQSRTKTITLTIHTASRVGKATGVDAPFQVSETLAEAVEAEMRDRTVLRFSTTDIRRVVINDKNRSLSITKDHNDDYVNEGPEKIDQSAAGGLFDTLAGLRIERYVAQSTGTTNQLNIDVELISGETHLVKVALTKDDDWTVTIGPLSYTISEQVFEKLTASLIDEQAQ